MITSYLYKPLDRLRIPGRNGRHEQVQATGPMHLIFQGTITQLSQTTEEELAGERVQRFSFVEPDENEANEVLR